jgi:biotin transporter BioY
LVLADLILIGTVDIWTGPEFDFSISYLIPVVLVTWFASRGWGWRSLLGAVVWFIQDETAGQAYA